MSLPGVIRNMAFQRQMRLLTGKKMSQKAIIKGKYIGSNQPTLEGKPLSSPGFLIFNGLAVTFSHCLVHPSSPLYHFHCLCN